MSGSNPRRAASRRLTPLDRLLVQLDLGVKTVAGGAHATRPSPAAEMPDASLDPAEREESARLMRVNHAGEIAAQALYQGQAVTARSARIRTLMESAAAEERDHLAWCSSRLIELEGRKSILDPIWFSGSFLIGALAGAAGDRWSLGFVAETERQVGRHLETHLGRLPAADIRSRAVIERMREDEAQHGSNAENAGATPLPRPIRGLMAGVSRVMTYAAYRL